jgi:hypothetical protein
MTDAPSTPFRFDDRAFNLPPENWQAGDPWDKRYANPTLEDRDRSIEDYITSRVDATLATLAQGMVYTRSLVSANPSSYDVFQDGVVTDTWDDSFGNTGTGYPRVTATLRSSGSCVVIVSGTPTNVANSANHKTYDILYGFGLDGAAPTGVQYRRFVNNNAATVEGPSTFVQPFATTTGAHEFKLWVYYASTAGVVFLPSFETSSIVVLPL